MTRALIASLVAAAGLAVAPAAALGQDAGGNQYDDPLAGTPSSPSTPSTPSTPSAPSTPSTSSSGTAGTPTASAGGATSSATTGTTATATAAAAGEIPRTGFPAGWLTLAGFFAVGGGFALRRVAGPEPA
jgi:hypothetical protein